MKNLLLILLFLPAYLWSQDLPNILWITVEDISPTLSFYGDSTAHTPHLDALAAKSTIYENAFAPVGVCAPARSSIITGMQPTAIGTMHMRTGKDMMSWGKRQYKSKINATDINGDTLREYAAVLPAEVKCFTEYLRAAGYYCTNNQKTDYQFAAPITAWDENNNRAHWRNCPTEQPFFSVFNFNETHESKLWKVADKPLTVEPNSVFVPPYFPDNAVVRQDIARHYSNIELMDKKVGKLIAQLKADGLYDETIIFFFSDHGGPLPRQKRAIYDSGLRVPFMVKMPQQKGSRRVAELVSFPDLAPTMLSLADIMPPDYLQGQAFLGNYQAATPRDYIIGSGDRFDEHTDRSRIVRDTQFLYVRNFFPEKAHYKDITYRKNNVLMMQNMLDLQEKTALNSTQNTWFLPKAEEELYDTKADPHQIHNLATAPNYQKQLQKMRSYYADYFDNQTDLGQVPERQLIDSWWQNGEQPQTITPTCTITDQEITLHSPTKGASIAYFFSDNSDVPTDIFATKTVLYTHSVTATQAEYICFLAERIGFQTSEAICQKIAK